MSLMVMVKILKLVTREVLGFEIRAWSAVEILPVVRNKSDYDTVY